MINIDTARIFIPRPTGFTLNAKTYGIRVLGYDKTRYQIFQECGNRDDANKYSDLYHILSACYAIDLSSVPDVRPYVKYIDYMKNVGGISGQDAESINYLQKNCNTLIVRSDAERQFLQHLYSNAQRRSFGMYAFDWKKEIPQRFENISDGYVAELIRRVSSASYSRVR